jgi:hypothetical protein
VFWDAFQKHALCHQDAHASVSHIAHRTKHTNKQKQTRKTKQTSKKQASKQASKQALADPCPWLLIHFMACKIRPVDCSQPEREGKLTSEVPCVA